MTYDWLYELMRIINIYPRLGMIGPVSNQVGNIQKIQVGYKRIDEIQGWAQQYTHQQAYDYRAVNMLGFFCLMMKREVFDEVGLLDENYGVGMFEDDDYCKEVSKAGYELGYTKKVFIHHYGSASFNKLSNREYQGIWNKNKTYFENKWGTKWSNDLIEFESNVLKHGKTDIDWREYHRYQLQKILEI